MITDDLSRIPENVALTFKDTQQSSLLKEPFIFKGKLRSPARENYCINLFLGNTHYGTCAISDDLHPVSSRDKILFREFAEYATQLLSAHPIAKRIRDASLRTVFSDLLHGLPVSSHDVDYFVQLIEHNLFLRKKAVGQWHVLAIRSANRNKTLPGEYLCASLENLLPNCAAVAMEEEVIACLAHVPEGEGFEESICNVLLPYLNDMNFRCGASAPFDDLMKAKAWFIQAEAILKVGSRYSPEQHLYRFQDFILPYMLCECPGEFDDSMLLTPGLKKLRELDAGVDYWGTLRLYLENECNAARTARDLYIHRSSLLPRLEKIRLLVDIDSPSDQLYLRMCISLLDLEERRRQG